eukprot:TRINITY_DN5646_c0_g1_i10.p3 TRINITY_DN5646_c0_g1~~TRINITY_DN5646_c0_g1_i10.p3  ORF type:complete len:309 (-),score=33.04 TRINITY_DN5646_c0_g1_i10:3390-4316(-)
MTIRRVLNPLVCHGHSRPIVEVNYSPITADGYFLVSASKDASPMLRRGETGDWIGTFQGHKGAVWSCVLNQPAMIAATASADFTARIWDALTGDERHQFTHKHIVRSVQFGTQDDRLLTGCMDKTLQVYDINRPDAPPQIVGQLPDGVRCSSWCNNDRLTVCSFIKEPGVAVVDMTSGSVIHTLPTSKPVTSIEVNQNHITTADGDTVRIWDINSLSTVGEFTMPYTVESATLTVEHNRFVAAGSDMWVHLYDLKTGAELECNRGHHGPIHAVRFAPDGLSYASGSEDGTIRIWVTDGGVEEDPTVNA